MVFHATSHPSINLDGVCKYVIINTETRHVVRTEIERWLCYHDLLNGNEDIEHLLMKMAEMFHSSQSTGVRQQRRRQRPLFNGYRERNDTRGVYSFVNIFSIRKFV